MNKFIMDMFSQNELPLVIGHRGACGYAPENTLASFQKAHELGVTWVEFDVRLTSCGEVVVVHDWNLERTTNGQGEVNETPYTEMAKLDAGSWFDKQFASQQIPTLKNVLCYLSEHRIKANLEIKPHPGKEQQIVTAIYHILQEVWPKNLPMIISSFSIECLQLLRAQDEKIVLGLLVDSWEGEWLATAQQLNCLSIHVNHLIVTPAMAEVIKQNGFYLFAYTVNEIQRANELFALGVEAVFSDYPDLVANSLPLAFATNSG